MSIITGTPGNDFLIGTPGNDSIFGLSGNDTIFGGEGNDTIVVEGTSGFLDGAGGSNTVIIPANYVGVLLNFDKILTTSAAITVPPITPLPLAPVFLTNGSDVFTGTPGNDTIVAGTGNDSINAGAGNDLIFGNLGNNTIFGGAGNDTVVIDGDTGFLDGGDGDDTVIIPPTFTGTVLNFENVKVGTQVIPSPTKFEISPATLSLSEGNVGTTNFVFTVTRTGNASVAATIDFIVTGTGINPASGTDFVGGIFPSGTVKFAPGETKATVTLPVQGDVAVEPDQTFTVTLSNPSSPGGSFITTPSATGTIVNDDTVEPTLVINPVALSQPEGDAGATNFVFTVLRSGDLSLATTVSFDVTGSGASPANSNDFVDGVLPSGEVRFAPGQAVATIIVPVEGDTVVEPNENFTLSLSAPINGTIVSGVATGTIVDDDFVPVPPALILTPAFVSQPEGNTGTSNFIFTVVRSGDVTKASTVNFDVVGSGTSPADAKDFVAGVLPSGEVEFAPGQAVATIIVPVQGDTLVEPNENFTLSLSDAIGATISIGTATGTIVDDDTAPALPSLSIIPQQLSQPEGNKGATNFIFTVLRSGDLTKASTTSFAVTGSGATPAKAEDFFGAVFPSGKVEFTPGQAVATIVVPVQGETVVEPNESFTLTLSDATNATIASGVATGTIIDDDFVDVPPALVITPTFIDKFEGDAGTNNFVFTVLRAGNISSTSSVDFKVSSTSIGLNLDDFIDGVIPAGTVKFASGEAAATITIPVRGDTVFEFDESFSVDLSNPIGATIASGSAFGTIVNDDKLPTVSVGPANVTKNEGNVGQTDFVFTVTRTGASDVPAFVDFTVTGSGANPADAKDFVGGVLPPTKQLTIAPGGATATATITVPVQGDTVVEADETFTLTLSNPINTSIVTGTAIGTIVNDDATFTLSPATIVLPEGSVSTTAFSFVVTREGNTAVPASVKFDVTGSGAFPANALDFPNGKFPSGVVEFLPGQITGNLIVVVQGDTENEPDETFTVTLSAPVGGTIVPGKDTAVGTILNDDLPPVPILKITPDVLTLNEGNGGGTTNFTFTVTRTGDLAAVSSVKFAVTGSGANPANTVDFVGGVLPSGIVNFAAGAASQTFNIPVVADAVFELDEGFTVTLSDAVNGTIDGKVATATIKNDDAAPSLTITPADLKLNEGNIGETKFVFTVTRDGLTDLPAVFDFAVTGTGVNPADGKDFVGGVFPAGTGVTIAPGGATGTATISIPVQGDTETEPDQTFTVTLTNPINSTIAVGKAIGTIKNDELVGIDITTGGAFTATPGVDIFVYRFDLVAGRATTPADGALASITGFDPVQDILRFDGPNPLTEAAFLATPGVLVVGNPFGLISTTVFFDANPAGVTGSVAVFGINDPAFATLVVEIV